MSKQEGPRTRTTHSCFGCVHCESESYCKHPEFATQTKQRQYIGLSWTTPKWCPFLVKESKT